MVDQDASAPLSNNRRTVDAYDVYAERYAEAVKGAPSGVAEEGLRRLADLIAPGGTVLEIGSGPGWDADHLETLGVAVHRTEIAPAFCALQTRRGKSCEPLDLIADPLGGPYAGIVALFVLQHIDRTLIPAVLGKIAAALDPGGVFLASIQLGEGEVWNRDTSSGDYHVVRWSEADFAAALVDAGLGVTWSAQTADEEGTWLRLIARRGQVADC